MNNEFKKPLIVYKENSKSYLFYKDEKQLGVCNYQAKRSGFYDDMLIFTSAGNCYRILHMKIVKFRKWPLLDWLLGSPMIELEFDFIPAPNPFSFDDFKKKLTGFIKKDEYFENILLTNQILDKIKAANNYDELAAIFDLNEFKD